jgi:carbohydrate kinase (thermoresistant glucokinase family)
VGKFFSVIFVFDEWEYGIPMVLVLMGVSGCGKTTIGKMLADKLSCTFYDGDDYHPESNIKKMAGGQPLNDSDRLPWLKKLNNILSECNESGRDAVLACSALKKTYRDLISKDIDGLQFVFLKGDFNLINERMQKRKDHYMKADMLRSQFEILEEPDNVVVMDINDLPSNIVTSILRVI